MPPDAAGVAGASVVVWVDKPENKLPPAAPDEPHTAHALSVSTPATPCNATRCIPLRDKRAHVPGAAGDADAPAALDTGRLKKPPLGFRSRAGAGLDAPLVPPPVPLGVLGLSSFFAPLPNKRPNMVVGGVRCGVCGNRLRLQSHHDHKNGEHKTSGGCGQHRGLGRGCMIWGKQVVSGVHACCSDNVRQLKPQQPLRACEPHYRGLGMQGPC